MLYNIVKPVLFLFDAEKSHNFITGCMSFFGKSRASCGITSLFFNYKNKKLNMEILGLTFPNPIGLAPGFDKQCRLINIIPSFGFGFIEVGTITKHEQAGNEKPRMFRLVKDKALINRLGFNNAGADKAARKLYKARYTVPVGVNIGKSKITPLDKANEDYLCSFEKLYSYADYFTINVSSPNTPELRKLQTKARLNSLLKALVNKNQELAKKLETEKKPIFVKIDPDMDFKQLDDVLDVIKKNGLDGIIATNTTLGREGLMSEESLTSQQGGLSGQPLKDRSTQIISYIYSKTKGKLLIIGVGGIATTKDAYDKIRAGASLVQVYTGFIYNGPSTAKKINKGLVKLLKKDGFNSVREAVGAAHK